MITFPTSPRVTPGEPLRAGHLQGLSSAINARLRSGIADGVPRIGYYWRNLALQAGVSDTSQAQFWTHRHDGGDSPPPETGSILPAFTFGTGAVDAEAVRLNGLPLAPGGTTASDYWALGKSQRGAWDPESGAISSPSFTAARGYSGIRWRWWSPQGAAWGGYLPSPALLGTSCEDPNTSDDIPAPPNYALYLTSLRTGYADIAFDGTCQDGPDVSTPGMYDSHVYAWGDTPWSYVVQLNDGTVTEYSKAHYVEGPYTGDPRLRRTWARGIERIMSHFAAEFRGVDGNAGVARSNWWRKALDFQRFLRAQYLLAPARGTTMGDSIVDHYPTQTLSTKPSPVLLPAAGCVFAACLVSGAVRDTVTIEAVDGEVVISTTALTPDTSSVVMVWHPTPSSLSFSMDRNAGRVTVEVAELMDYRPGPWDWLLVTRIGGMVNAE